MAIVTVPYNPDLTAAQAMEAFTRHFGSRYEVCKANQLKRDFILKKSSWSGVGVRLKQEPGKTSFVFTALMPNLTLRILFSGLVSYLILRTEWRKLETEVAEYIDAAPEFHPQAKPARAPKPPRTEQAAA